MSEYSALLKKIMQDCPDYEEITVSDEEYQKWKIDFERLAEHEKVFNLLGVLSQYLIGESRAAASVFVIAVICTQRWCNEKELEDF